MRLNPLYLLPLALTALAQNQVPLDDTPTPPTIRQQAEKYIEMGKKLAQVYMGSTPIDYESRDTSDKEAGVVRLTDENWDREMKAWDGDWVVVLHGGLYGGPTVPDPVSTHFLEMHTNATSLATQYISSPPLDEDIDKKLSNLQKIKWARLDYMTEWERCARWMITRPPWLVFVSNNGEDVRFLGTRSISPEGKKLFSFMANRDWENLTVWKPAPFFARVAELYIAAHHKIGGATGNIPKWVWLFIVPAATQGLVKFLFFGGGSAPAPTGAARPVPAARKNT